MSSNNQTGSAQRGGGPELPAAPVPLLKPATSQIGSNSSQDLGELERKAERAPITRERVRASSSRGVLSFLTSFARASSCGVFSQEKTRARSTRPTTYMLAGRYGRSPLDVCVASSTAGQTFKCKRNRKSLARQVSEAANQFLYLFAAHSKSRKRHWSPSTTDQAGVLRFAGEFPSSLFLYKLGEERFKCKRWPRSSHKSYAH